MSKQTVADIKDLAGKKVLVRVDFNVPLDDKQNITDDTRIRAAIPTIKYLSEKGAKVILVSHLGRPKAGPDDKLRMAPLAARLSQLIGKNVAYVKDCIGPQVADSIAKLGNGDLLLETSEVEIIGAHLGREGHQHVAAVFHAGLDIGIRGFDVAPHAPKDVELPSSVQAGLK